MQNYYLYFLLNILSESPCLPHCNHDNRPVQEVDEVEPPVHQNQPFSNPTDDDDNKMQTTTIMIGEKEHHLSVVIQSNCLKAELNY